MKRLVLLFPLSLPALLLPSTARAQYEGYEVVVSERYAATFGADRGRERSTQSLDMVAQCPVGKVVIGGGFSHNGGEKTWIRANTATASRNRYLEGEPLVYGWRIVAAFHRSDNHSTGRNRPVAAWVHAICVNAVQSGSVVAAAPSVSAAAVAPLARPESLPWADDFTDATLSQWAGKPKLGHSGSVVDDPLNSESQVLTFTAVAEGGDIFSPLLSVRPGQEYALCFDYLGSPVSGGSMGNGGAIGIGTGTPGNHRWLAGTTQAGGIEDDLLEDDGQWDAYRVLFKPEIAGASVNRVRVMVEDFTAPAGDVYFDNISLRPATEACPNPLLPRRLRPRRP